MTAARKRATTRRASASSSSTRRPGEGPQEFLDRTRAEAERRRDGEGDFYLERGKALQELEQQKAKAPAPTPAQINAWRASYINEENAMTEGRVSGDREMRVEDFDASETGWVGWRRLVSQYEGFRQSVQAGLRGLDEALANLGDEKARAGLVHGSRWLADVVGNGDVAGMLHALEEAGYAIVHRGKLPARTAAELHGQTAERKYLADLEARERADGKAVQS